MASIKTSHISTVVSVRVKVFREQGDGEEVERCGEWRELTRMYHSGR
jgi:hypothetical protein